MSISLETYIFAKRDAEDFLVCQEAKRHAEDFLVYQAAKRDAEDFLVCKAAKRDAEDFLVCQEAKRHAKKESTEFLTNCEILLAAKNGIDIELERELKKVCFKHLFEISEFAY